MEDNTQNLFYSMKDLAKLLPIGTNNLYNLVHSEGFPAIFVNRRILIPVDLFNEWIRTSAYKRK